MKYESLIDIIRTAAEAALSYGLAEGESPGTFIYANKGEASLKHDLPFPQIIMFNPDYREDANNPAIKIYSCVITAQGLDSDMNSSEERFAIESAMDALLNRFKRILDDSNDTILLVTTLNQSVQLQYASRSTGRATQCTITGALLGEACEPLAL